MPGRPGCKDHDRGLEGCLLTKIQRHLVGRRRILEAEVWLLQRDGGCQLHLLASIVAGEPRSLESS